MSDLFSQGQERFRQMFIECSLRPDDSKFTPRDMFTWQRRTRLWNP